MSLFPDGSTSGPFTALVLPPHVVGDVVAEAPEPGVVTTLGRRAFLPYGDSESLAIHDHEAQYVGPGQAKSGSEFDATVTQYHTHWFQKTVRLPIRRLEEFRAQGLDFIEPMIQDMLAALPRALDYAVIHGIDARSGTSIPALSPAIHDSSFVFDAEGATVYAGIDAARRALYSRKIRPTGIALDSEFAGALATARSGLSEAPLYPDFNALGVSTLYSMRSVVSDTVSARDRELAPLSFEPISAIIGDWSSLVWNIARPATVEVFTTGDPDNTGRDLAGHNEFAYRVEAAYTYGFDPDAFALITGTPREGSVGVTIPGVELIDVTANRVDVSQREVIKVAPEVPGETSPQVAQAVASEDSNAPEVLAESVVDEDPAAGTVFGRKAPAKKAVTQRFGGFVTLLLPARARQPFRIERWP